MFFQKKKIMGGLTILPVRFKPDKQCQTTCPRNDKTNAFPHESFLSSKPAAAATTTSADKKK